MNPYIILGMCKWITPVLSARLLHKVDLPTLDIPITNNFGLIEISKGTVLTFIEYLEGSFKNCCYYSLSLRKNSLSL